MATTAHYRNALPLQASLHEYRIEQVLGVGGFGMTYLARDTHLDKQVAIKEYLPSDLAMRAGDGTVHPASTEREADYRWGLERFLQEARTLAKFSHPHIVRVARYFEANATAYMVMEYEHGEPLKSMMAVNPQMDEAALRRILDPILEGLAAVHAAGFLHRDIKPDNIFIRRDGSPVLIDFGSARNALGSETRALTAVLTPGYAPLEQYATDGNQGPWTDLYALAGVLFQAASGKKPPDAVSRMRNDSVPAALAELKGRYSDRFLDALGWALRLDEKGRPQSVAQWRAAFSGAAPAPSVPSSEETTLVVNSPAAEPTLHVAPPAKRKPWLLYGVIAAVLIAAVGAFALMGGKQREPRERPGKATVAEEAKPAPPPPAPVEKRDEKKDEPKPAPAVVEKAPEKKPVAKKAEQKVDPLDAEWTAEFRNTDANRDGSVSQPELRARFPNVARNFERLDADSDGRVSLREYLQWRRQQHERRLEKGKN